MQVRAVLKMGKFSRDNSGQEISHTIPVSVRFPKNIHRHFTENSKTGHRFPRWSCYHRGRKKELPGDTFRAFASGMQSRSVRGIFFCVLGSSTAQSSNFPLELSAPLWKHVFSAHFQTKFVESFDRTCDWTPYYRNLLNRNVAFLQSNDRIWKSMGR